MATGGAALPLIIGLGAGASAVGIGTNLYNYAKADNDADAKAALEGTGTAAAGLALSLVGVKGANKAAANAGVKGLQGFDKASWGENATAMIKSIPEAFMQSGKNIKGNYTYFTNWAFGKGLRTRAEQHAIDIQTSRKTLGFEDGVEITPESLKARYRTLAVQNHPDKGGSAARMEEINAAYNFLSKNLKDLNIAAPKTNAGVFETTTQPKAIAQAETTRTSQVTQPTPAETVKTTQSALNKLINKYETVTTREELRALTPQAKSLQPQLTTEQQTQLYTAFRNAEVAIRLARTDIEKSIVNFNPCTPMGKAALNIVGTNMRMYGESRAYSSASCTKPMILSSADAAQAIKTEIAKQRTVQTKTPTNVTNPKHMLEGGISPNELTVIAQEAERFAPDKNLITQYKNGSTEIVLDNNNIVVFKMTENIDGGNTIERIVDANCNEIVSIKNPEGEIGFKFIRTEDGKVEILECPQEPQFAAECAGKKLEHFDENSYIHNRNHHLADAYKLFNENNYSIELKANLYLEVTKRNIWNRVKNPQRYCW